MTDLAVVHESATSRWAHIVGSEVATGGEVVRRREEGRKMRDPGERTKIFSKSLKMASFTLKTVKSVLGFHQVQYPDFSVQFLILFVKIF